MVTVAELIEDLQQFPSDQTVQIEGCDCVGLAGKVVDYEGEVLIKRGGADAAPEPIKRTGPIQAGEAVVFKWDTAPDGQLTGILVSNPANRTWVTVRTKKQAFQIPKGDIIGRANG